MRHEVVGRLGCYSRCTSACQELETRLGSVSSPGAPPPRLPTHRAREELTRPQGPTTIRPLTFTSLLAAGVAVEMTPVVLRMVMAALADRTTQVTEVPQHLGLYRTTLCFYVHGDGSLKARGQALLTSQGETVRTAG